MIYYPNPQRKTTAAAKMFDVKLILTSAVASALSLYAVSTIAAKFTVTTTVPEYVKNKLRYVHHLTTLHDVSCRREMAPTRELNKAYVAELLALYEWRSTFLMHESKELQMQVLLNFYVYKNAVYHWNKDLSNFKAEREFCQIHNAVYHWNKDLSKAEAEAEFCQIHDLPHFESFIAANY